MKLAIVPAIVAALSIVACKPRMETASALRTTEAPQLSDFDALLERIDQTSQQVALNQFAGQSAPESSVEGFALTDSGDPIVSEIDALIQRVRAIQEKETLSDDDRDLLSTLAIDLDALVQLAPDLTPAQTNAAKSVLAKAAERLTEPVDVGDVQIAMSTGMACLLAKDKVTCWGGEPKVGSDPAKVKPPADLKAVEKIVVGLRDACAIADNQVRCWGTNAYRDLQGIEGLRAVDITIANSQDPDPREATVACALEHTGKISCVGPADRGIYNESADRFGRIALADYGYMVCAWHWQVGWISCHGNHGAVDRKEIPRELDYPDKRPTKFALVTEGVDMTACLSGREGVHCRRSIPGAKRRGGKGLVKFPQALDVANSQLCVMQNGVTCTEEPVFGATFAGLEGAVAFDVAWDFDRDYVACGAFRNGKVKCVTKKSKSLLMKVPQSIRAP